MKLPRASGAEAVRAFERLGWEVVRTVGSHVILKHAEKRKGLSVPQHKELRTGTLRGLIRAAEMSVEDFRRALDG